MKSTWMAAGLVAVVTGLHAATSWEAGPVVWTVLAVALASSVVVDVVRARYAAPATS